MLAFVIVITGLCLYFYASYRAEKARSLLFQAQQEAIQNEESQPTSPTLPVTGPPEPVPVLILQVDPADRRGVQEEYV